MPSCPPISRLARWCLLLTLVATGCADTKEPGRATAASPSTLAPTSAVCNGDGEVNQDDEVAVGALLRLSHLPTGDWTVADTPPCPWALSADEILAVPACRAAASSVNAPANDEARNGNARTTFTSSDDAQLDDRIEIYTSRQNVDALRAILAGPSMPACYSAAVQHRAAAEPGTSVDDIHASRFAIETDATQLGLGFPATDGYAADAGFAEGVDITFTRTSNGSTEPVAMRVITFGSGGLMSTVTLTGATRADLDAIDLTDTVRAAATEFKTMSGAN